MRPLWAVAAVLVAATAGRAQAQAGDVTAWIALIEAPPSGMDRATWKDRRRDAARRLAASGDPRAVPVLIRLVETESFDIIGEIAIDGLGQLGDARAVPVLQKVAADPSRDRGQRDHARRALARLGSSAAAPAPDGPPDAATGAPVRGETTTVPPDTTGSVPVATAPATAVGDDAGPGDVLAESERVTFAVGGARLGYDTVRDRASLDADLSARYRRRVDKPGVAWRLDGDAALVAGAVDPDGPGSTRGAVLDLGARGEGRGYTGGGLYAVGALIAGAQTTYVSIDRANPDQDDLRDVRISGDAGVELGGGWGRVLDVGSRLRARRLATLLAARRALGRPIDDELAARLQRAWWSLRGELGGHRRLTATVALLREAGVLLGEPDAGLVYELLEILRDPALDDRASGLDAQLVFSESYLVRDDIADSPLRQDGRLEELRLRVAYGRQLPGDTSDLTGEGFARARILAGDGVPAPWLVAATARLRRFAYGDHLDPTGALDVSATVAASDDDLAETDLGVRVGAGVGWSVAWSRASWIRVGGDLAVDSGEIFVGLSLAATYGLLDASFARSL